MKFQYILMLLCLPLLSFAQPANIDSLLEELADNEMDTNRIKTLENLAEVYLYKNADSAYSFAKSAYELAKDLDVPGAMASASNTAGAAQYFMGDYLAALKEWQEALRIHQVMNNRERVAATLGNIGVVYKNQ